MEQFSVTDALLHIGNNLGALTHVLSQWLELERERLAKEYPPRKQVRDAEVHHLKTEEESIREAQGDTDQTDAEWIALGPRESAVVQKEVRRPRSA